MRFTYSARTRTGELQNGNIEAGSLDGALNILQRHNLIVVDVQAEKEMPFLAQRIKFFQKVKAKEKMIFSRQIATLFAAKIPLVESLRTLSTQMENLFFRDIVQQVAADVDSGTTLSSALEKHPKAFTGFYVHMVRAGEVSGKLEEVFEYLAVHEERDYTIRSKVKSVMTYPIVILSFFILVFVLVLIFIIPPLKDILLSGGMELPFLTKMVLFFSDAVINYWYLVGIVAASAGSGLFYFFTSEQGLDLWDNIKLKIPIVGKLFQKIYLARFCENLHTLIIGGLPITQSLEVTATVIGSKKYQLIIEQAVEEVRRGNPINAVLKRYPEFPPLVVSMVAVGESTGRLDQTLKNVSDFYQREVSDAIDTLVSLIEPAMIALLGIGTGVFLAAVLIPIYNIAQGMG
jgi:type IV pilus assembly protein PilC